ASVSEGNKECLVLVSDSLLSTPLAIKQEYNYFCISFVQRYSRKSSSVYENKSETPNVEASNNKNRNSSPSARQKRVDASTSLNLEHTALARKRFTLQGLSNRRAPPKDPESKEREVARRFSLASSISTTVNASTVTKGTVMLLA
ncbi:UNVERIFIED_CONTAM: hypothetical protein H355_000724, partial [Colinus virginianus]